MEAPKQHHQATIGHQPLKKCGSNTALAASASGCFDCNICLDFAADPVVTLCGHLYCWPCIYKWLNHSNDDTGDSPQHCPVCKANVSQNTLVPLYGHGRSAKASQDQPDTPRRPPALLLADRRPESPRVHRQQHFQTDRAYYPYNDHALQPSSPFRPQTGAGMLHFTSGGVFGGMAVAVLPWVFRNREASMQYASPFGTPGHSPPRIRRQEMEVERSLQQIWVFFCCCAFLCLFLF